MENEVLIEKLNIVVVEDTATKPGFLQTINGWLSENNYQYEVASEGAKHNLDQLTLEYVGHWSWDLATYLSQAKIEAFHQGQRVGEVHYRAPNSLNTNKFSNAAERIEYMLEVLFAKITAEDATQAIKSSKQSESQ